MMARSRHYDLHWSRANLAALLLIGLLASGGLAWKQTRCTPIGERVAVTDSLVRSARETIDPNTASSASMRRLSGIGPMTADRIVQYRSEHPDRPFRSAEDLEEIHGIGPKTVEKIRSDLKIVSVTHESIRE
jgi:competence ComEA-like helix-hairpin-helix protein